MIGMMSFEACQVSFNARFCTARDLAIRIGPKLLDGILPRNVLPDRKGAPQLPGWLYDAALN